MPFLALLVSFRKMLSVNLSYYYDYSVLLGWNGSGVSFVLVKTDHRPGQQHTVLLVQWCQGFSSAWNANYANYYACSQYAYWLRTHINVCAAICEHTIYIVC